MTTTLMLCAGMAAGAAAMAMWQRLRDWRDARKVEWDPY